ncbi:MAG: DUF4329 domain-containing protein [Pontiella sp.]
MTSFALYEAYGTRPYEWGEDPDRQKTNTKEEETDLDLLNEGMRYRDLETGTFLTRDPIGYGDGPNVYCYVHCNPITHFDSFGLSDEEVDEYEEMDAEEFEEETTEASVDPDVINENIDAPSQADAAMSTAEKLNDQKSDGGTSNSASDASEKNKKEFKGATGFDHPDDAAKHTFDQCNPQSKDENKEYGGTIYSYKDENGDAKYGYTAPRTDGERDSFDPNKSIDAVPDGANIVGLYHTHGNYETAHPVTGNPYSKEMQYYANKETNRFSGSDRANLRQMKKIFPTFETSYLATPDDRYRGFPASGGSYDL